MFSDESSPFELEENELDFNEICSKLEKHPFSSPWKMYFQDPADELITEVTEFVIDHNLMADSSLPVKLDMDTSSCIPQNASKINIAFYDVPIDEKKVTRLKESLMTVQDNSTLDHIHDLDIFFMIPSSQIPVLFKMLNVSVLSEAAITLLLNTFLHFKDKISMATAVALVHYIICPVVFKMKKNSSSLLTTILKFAEVYPKVVIDEMMIPYFKDKMSDNLKSEILFQISKVNLPHEYVAYCIKSVLEHAHPGENLFAILQCLIERKVHLENSLYDLLLKKLLSWTSTCNSNVKFTKLLTSILSTYGSELTGEQILLCDEVLKNNKTIIKKAAENLVKKLKQGKENF